MATQSVRGKVIVITGASSGFGKGAALAFAAQGASLVLAARRESLLDELARECEAQGSRAIAVPTDVSKADEVAQLAQAALSQFGRIDVWINDSGVGALGRFEEIPLADHIQVIETNLLGTLYGSYLALKQFKAQNFGILINIASALGKMPSPYYASYAASKHGIVGLDGVLRQELAQDKIESIRVCTVMPMSMDTPFFDHASNYTGHETKPIPPLYDEQMTVDVIVRLATEPEDEVVVGAAGKIMGAAHNVMPGLVEATMGKISHRVQMEDAEPAADTSGSVQQPVPEGTEVSGGRLKH